MTSRPKVSVIVPVYNPGALIEECVGSLLNQSLAAAEYETILVDDGSTDGTASRLDDLQRAHPHVRVRHIPNSGWPGHPRNVGLDMANGEYVYFVDNDDWIEHEALARMYEAAARDAADVVVGKVIGHGKPVTPTLFARNRSGVGPDWVPLLWLLTPHKLFRRAMLDAHGLRFPEGRRRLEDHMFVLSVYFRTDRVSIVADYPCYHWMLRDRSVNASAEEFEPVAYYRDLRQVLDLVDEHVDPGPLRDRLYARWYQGKMLGRVGGRIMLNRAPAMRRARFDEIRVLTEQRFSRTVDAHLPFNFQVRSELVRRGDYDALEAMAEQEVLLHARVRADVARVASPLSRFHRRRRLPLRLEARLDDPGGLLRFRAQGDRLAWQPPDRIARAIDGSSLEPKLESCSVQLFLQDEASGTPFLVPVAHSAHLESDPGAPGTQRVRFDGHATISSGTAAAGAPLAAGDWGLRATVAVAGFKNSARVRDVRGDRPLVVRVDRDGHVVIRRRVGRARAPGGLLRARRRLRRVARALGRRRPSARQ